MIQQYTLLNLPHQIMFPDIVLFLAALSLRINIILLLSCMSLYVDSKSWVTLYQFLLHVHGAAPLESPNFYLYFFILHVLLELFIIRLLMNKSYFYLLVRL